MFDETQHSPEKPNPEVTKFKKLIGKADGSLIPLSKKTPNGKQLLVTARFYKVPESGHNEFIDYDKSADQELEEDNVTLVNIYTQEASGLEPIGHIDWWGSGDYANGGGNMHRIVTPQNEHEKKAKDKWGFDTIAFKVEDKYQGQGIGTFLIATSTVVLRKVGYRVFYPGHLRSPAIKTYQRFQITEDQFPQKGHWLYRHLPLRKLSQNPLVEKSLSEFV